MKLLDFLKNIGKTIWEAFLNNAVVLVMAFILSGGYLVAINKIKDFQIWVRGIPTDYVLTPLVFLLFLIVVLVGINQKQKKALSKFQQEPLKDESDKDISEVAYEILNLFVKADETVLNLKKHYDFMPFTKIQIESGIVELRQMKILLHWDSIGGYGLTDVGKKVVSEIQ